MTSTTYPSALDIDDVYQVRLASNERLEATLTPPRDADFDLYLIAPGTRLLRDAFRAPYTPILVASERATGAADAITYVNERSAPATFYLDVASQAQSSGEYRLTWRRTRLTTPTIETTAPAVIGFGRTALVRGSALAQGRAMSGFTMELYHLPAGARAWAKLESTRTDPGGRYAFRVTPGLPTKYRVKSMASPTGAGTSVGYGWGSVVQVAPRAQLAITSAASRATHGRRFVVSGQLKPAHRTGSGHVTVHADRYITGRGWIRYRTAFPARHTATGFSATVMLPWSGAWRLQAVAPADDLHAATESGFRRVTVR